MDQKKSIQIILVVSLIGILFSGYLSYSEIALGVCPAGGCGKIAGVPTCVYGLVMYLIIFIAAIAGLHRPVEKSAKK
jgi:uncharacterized membrane protein